MRVDILQINLVYQNLARLASKRSRISQKNGGKRKKEGEIYQNMTAFIVRTYKIAFCRQSTIDTRRQEYYNQDSKINQ